MGLRLHAMNLWLRLTVKRALRRMKDPSEMKAAFIRDAKRYFIVPEGANFVQDLMRRPGEPRKVGMIEALCACQGRPDRRKVILFLHGGAYLAGSPATHKHLAAALAGAAGVRAVLPDYRLAPEHPFPASVEDALAAYRHLLAAGYAPGEIALAGDSAGGGLVFALMQKLQSKALPMPACAVAFSPWADLTGTAKSLRTNALRDVMLPAERLDEVVGYYLNGHDRADPLASPALGQWNAPPPVLITASRSEILHDDAVRMAESLRASGGNVQLEIWKNLPHAWQVFTGRLAQADQSIASAGAFIARHLDAEPEDWTIGSVDPKGT